MTTVVAASADDQWRMPVTRGNFESSCVVAGVIAGSAVERESAVGWAALASGFAEEDAVVAGLDPALVGCEPSGFSSGLCDCTMELPSCSLFNFNQIPPATTTTITTSTSASSTPRRLLVAAGGSTAVSGSAIVCLTSVGSLTVAAAIGDSASVGFAIFGSRGCSAAGLGSDLGLAVSGAVIFERSGVFASTMSPITLEADGEVDVFPSGAGLGWRSATTNFWSV